MDRHTHARARTHTHTHARTHARTQRLDEPCWVILVIFSCTEHLNIILFELARNYHSALQKVDVSDYSVHHTGSVPSRGSQAFPSWLMCAFFQIVVYLGNRQNPEGPSCAHGKYKNLSWLVVPISKRRSSALRLKFHVFLVCFSCLLVSRVFLVSSRFSCVSRVCLVSSRFSCVFRVSLVSSHFSCFFCLLVSRVFLVSSRFVCFSCLSRVFSFLVFLVSSRFSCFSCFSCVFLVWFSCPIISGASGAARLRAVKKEGPNKVIQPAP